MVERLLTRLANPSAHSQMLKDAGNSSTTNGIATNKQQMMAARPTR